MRIIAILAIAGVIGLMMFSCTEKLAINNSFTEEIDRSINVRTIEVEASQLSNYLDLSGEVSASTAVDVYADTAGKLIQLLVKEGELVQKGQTIAMVDPSRPGMVYAKSPVVAPADGTVIRINWDQGATVGPQTPILQISELDNLKITARVPERFISQVKLGQTAEVGSTAFAGQLFNARVIEISPLVHPSSRTMEITLELQERNPMKPGMFLGIRLTTSTKENALVIPEEALIKRYDEKWVYRIVDGKAEKTAITTGIESFGKVEIINGLTAGDEIALEGKTLLTEGCSVRVINQVGLFNNPQLQEPGI